jgi:hypothetical protein
MSEEDRPLICGVCGEEIKAGEPVVQAENGVIAHIRCVRAENLRLAAPGNHPRAE